MKKNLEKQVNENIKTHLSLIKLSDEIDKAIKVISKKLQNGGKLCLTALCD